MSEKQGPPSYDQLQGGYPQQQSYPAGYQPVSGGQQYGQPQYGQPGQPPYGQPGQPMYGQPGQPYTTQQVIVSQPGQAGVIVTQPRPPDYMIPSVLACLCCFCPTGLCAIYYASRANTLAAEGDMAEATRMSNNARNLMITSVVIGVAWIILVIVLRLVVFATTTSYSYEY